MIEEADSILNLATVNGALDLLSRIDKRPVLLWLEVGLLGEVGSRLRVALHREVIKNQSIDVTAIS